MKNFFTKEILAHPLVLSAAVVAVVLALGSGAYYWSGSKAPQVGSGAVASSTQTLVGTGAVETAQNGDLAFVSGGRVVRVAVKVGDKVSQGQLLASLDTGTLSAGRAQAAANLKAAQAKLSQMQAGARQVDVDAKQTAVTQATQTLSDEYASAANAVSNAYSAAYGALHTDTDTLFTNPDTAQPALAFNTNGSQTENDALSGRVAANGEMGAWSTELKTFSSLSSAADVETALSHGIAHLAVLRSYGNALSSALSAAIATTHFPASSIAAGNTATGAMQASVAAQTGVLIGESQKLAQDKLAVQSAEDALAQTQAGSTQDELNAQEAAVEGAQASVDSYDAQIRNALIVAPFAGTVGSVQVKAGDIVGADTLAVSVTPGQALQVGAYFSEQDAARISVGQTATVTLDAYGVGRPFAATVVSVDRSPTDEQGVPAYKVVLQFTHADPAITVGMTANVAITQ